MSNTEYITVAGIVQFDPRPREVNGKPVRDITIKAIGTGKQMNVTVWPDFAHVPINKGDFIAADGAYTSKPGQTKDGDSITYHNVSANTLFVAASASKAGSPAQAMSTISAEAQKTSDENIPF